jgi:hypothetical protein
MEIIFEGITYIVCGESTGLGAYASVEGKIGEERPKSPHCLNQWSCGPKVRDCPMAIFTRGRERGHNSDTFPETRRTG